MKQHLKRILIKLGYINIACSLKDAFVNKAYSLQAQWIFFTSTAPFVMLYAPLALLCQIFKVRFVINIAEGCGHTLAEFDYFLRRKESIGNFRYVLILNSKPISKQLICLYQHHFFFSRCSFWLFLFVTPLYSLFPGLCIDSGISRLKWNRYDMKKREIIPIKNIHGYGQISPKAGMAEWNAYIDVKRQTCAKNPLLLNDSSIALLKEKMNLSPSKIAAIHIKQHVINATARSTDPSSYLPTMRYLLDQGYQLVFVGRECMPEQFKKLPICNYANSPLATFENDIKLFSTIDFALICGSGIGMLADCFDKPVLYVNFWHLAFAIPTALCVTIPTLVRSKRGFLTFKEQIDLYFSSTGTHEVFPYTKYEAVNASAEEILEGAKELFSLLDFPTMPLSHAQRQFIDLLRGQTILEKSRSRTSQFFLQRHHQLLQQFSSASLRASTQKYESNVFERRQDIT